jgi:hypothetical protein
MLTVAAICGALVLLGLYSWQHAQDLVLDHWNPGRPDLAEWAVRSAAIAGIALAQVVLLTGVAGRIYRRGIFDSVLALTSVAVCALASVSAIACGLAGR